MLAHKQEICIVIGKGIFLGGGGDWSQFSQFRLSSKANES